MQWSKVQMARQEEDRTRGGRVSMLINMAKSKIKIKLVL